MSKSNVVEFKTKVGLNENIENVEKVEVVEDVKYFLIVNYMEENVYNGTKVFEIRNKVFKDIIFINSGDKEKDEQLVCSVLYEIAGDTELDFIESVDEVKEE